jgi:hypothetical protein
MSDPIIEASTSGWIAQHRELYQRDPEAAHLFDKAARLWPRGARIERWQIKLSQARQINELSCLPNAGIAVSCSHAETLTPAIDRAVDLGVEVVCDHRVDRSRLLELARSHDAVLVATGLQRSIDLTWDGPPVNPWVRIAREEEETHRMYDAVKNSDIVFQLGHQQRQTESHIKAREVIEAGILGEITLIETTTNRNDPWGAWVWDTCWVGWMSVRVNMNRVLNATRPIMIKPINWVISRVSPWDCWVLERFA